MYRCSRTCSSTLHAWVAVAAVWLFSSSAVQAQGSEASRTGNPSALSSIYAAAWARQPEAASLPLRREAASAQREAARLWTPEPPALELSNRTDQLYRNRGSRELDGGIAIPLWLPGEREGSAALADATLRAVESRSLAVQLRVAGIVRDVYWQWQRALGDAVVAGDQLANARLIADDVARRVKSGVLARADQHQADAAVAVAESTVAQAGALAQAAEQQLRALTGAPLPPGAAGAAAPPPEPRPRPDSPDVLDPALHASVRDIDDRAAVASRFVALARVRSRGNPELTLSSARGRDSFEEAWNPTLMVGIRVPLGAGSRATARVAGAQADATELRTLAALERDFIESERTAARVRVEGAQTSLEAAERRARLAAESRGFFERSFRLGETDLPTRLRIEAEAIDAQRQAARGGIELSAAISRWRQALGLLPE